jgi:23S rRNA A1618 N6-methylase RlmF
LSVDQVRDIEPQRNEQIVSNAWNEKEQIHSKRCNVPFTRIERAFTATVTTATPGIPSEIVSVNTEEEIERDETNARLVATTLKSQWMPWIISKSKMILFNNSPENRKSCRKNVNEVLLPSLLMCPVQP